MKRLFLLLCIPVFCVHSENNLAPAISGTGIVSTVRIGGPKEGRANHGKRSIFFRWPTRGGGNQEMEREQERGREGPESGTGEIGSGEIAASQAPQSPSLSVPPAAAAPPPSSNRKPLKDLKLRVSSSIAILLLPVVLNKLSGAPGLTALLLCIQAKAVHEIASAASCKVCAPALLYMTCRETLPTLLRLHPSTSDLIYLTDAASSLSLSLLFLSTVLRLNSQRSLSRSTINEQLKEVGTTLAGSAIILPAMASIVKVLNREGGVGILLYGFFLTAREFSFLLLFTVVTVVTVVYCYRACY